MTMSPTTESNLSVPYPASSVPVCRCSPCMYHVLPFQSLSASAILSVPCPTALISVCNTIPFLCRLDLVERNDGTCQQIPLRSLLFVYDHSIFSYQGKNPTGPVREGNTAKSPTKDRGRESHLVLHHTMMFRSAMA